MRAYVLEAHGQPLVEREVPDPEPGPGEVVLRVAACGICHGDVNLAYEDWAPLPRIIGHEVAGTVERLGPGVAGVAAGDRVGIGWLHHSCGWCSECRSGRPMLCEQGPSGTGIAADGGYAELMLAPAGFVAPVPDEMDLTEAAPLTCAGLTTFVGLRRAGLRAGDRVAVVGIGGLGHLAIQYAKAAGAWVVAVSRNSDKHKDALRFGADEFVVPGESLRDDLARLGGIDVALVTTINTAVAGEIIGALRPEGALVALGNGPAFSVSPNDLMARNLRVLGSLVGTPVDLAAALRLAARSGIHPQVECFPLDQANEAIARVHREEVRYRAVLVP